MNARIEAVRAAARRPWVGASGIGGALALALLLSGCWYPKERGQRLEERVEQIEDVGPAGVPGANAAITEHAKRVDATIVQLQKKLDELSAQREGTDASARDTELTAELRRLHDQLEQYGRRLDAVEATLAQASRGGGGQRVASTRRAPDRPVRREPAAATPPGTGSASAAPEPAAPTGGPSALAFAREQERKGEKAVARDLYEQYAVQYPTDPGTAEAYFRLGELAFGERRYGDAIVAYGKVASEFPRSDRAPEALLRTAESMQALGMKDDAATIFGEITRRYPASPAAARAKKRLAESE